MVVVSATAERAEQVEELVSAASVQNRKDDNADSWRTPSRSWVESRSLMLRRAPLPVEWERRHRRVGGPGRVAISPATDRRPERRPLMVTCKGDAVSAPGSSLGRPTSEAGFRHTRWRFQCGSRDLPAAEWWPG
ncbi:hypothetical protein SY2F82_68340 [Streptomyces sp. Y2F8-2]|nr:hypothetical protein SY2F82_68340 [Streptomyces sp. Y2F8-2]